MRLHHPPPPRAWCLAAVPARPGFSPLIGDFRSSCFQAGPVARAGVCARLGENPTPCVVEASALRGLLFRNVSPSGNPELRSRSLWYRGAGCDRGMTLDTTLATGLNPLSLRHGSASSLWSDYYTIKPLVPRPPTLSIKEQNQMVSVCGPFCLLCWFLVWH